MKVNTAFILVSSFILLLPFKSSAASGYRTVVGCEEGFVAAGTEGRIDWFSLSGNKIKSVKWLEVEFKALLAYDGTVVVAGDSGTLLVSTNHGAFDKVESGTRKSILSLVRFQDRVVAGLEQGELLIGQVDGAFKTLQLNLMGNIVSLSARASDCFGATDRGEIIHTTDGVHWSILDFNAYYSGYYKPCHFTRILAMDHQIAVAGLQDDGSPVLMISAQGTIWAERSLSYTDDLGGLTLPTEIPSDLFYDASEDQLLLVSSKGVMMKIPSCSHCNKHLVVSAEDLTGIARNGNTWMVVGANFHHVIDASNFESYGLKQE